MYDSLKDKQVDDDLLKMDKKINKCWEMTQEAEKWFGDYFSYEHIFKNHIEYQRAEYIDDGFFIKVHSDKFELGNEDGVLKTANTIQELYEKSKEYF
jgi:hypothetical protein